MVGNHTENSAESEHRCCSVFKTLRAASFQNLSKYSIAFSLPSSPSFANMEPVICIISLIFYFIFSLYST